MVEELKDDWLKESAEFVEYLIGDGPDCLKCKHYKGEGTCKAFPEGIPQNIVLDASNHLKPVEGDNGFVYEEASEGVRQE